jgi:hypothetical protein
LLQKFRKSFLYSACSANSAMRMNLNILRTNFFFTSVVLKLPADFIARTEKNDSHDSHYNDAHKV